MKLLELIFKCLCISFGVIVLLLLTLSFWRLSGLFGHDLNQGGKAYYDYAPDSQYKAMGVYFQGEVVSFQLVLNHNEDVIYVARLWSEKDAPRRAPLWLGQSFTSTDYDRVSMSYMTETPLPGPFYERWYAWLFMTVRNVDLDKLEMIPD
ncbi:hypothetical protein [Vibrio sp. TBV020]|uniref:hypothetical protein n=1 Tax=Vibrio sp. TBV020 TaxID=3137398 RepID=UPI0038CD3151